MPYTGSSVCFRFCSKSTTWSCLLPFFGEDPSIWLCLFLSTLGCFPRGSQDPSINIIFHEDLSWYNFPFSCRALLSTHTWCCLAWLFAHPKQHQARRLSRCTVRETELRLVVAVGSCLLYCDYVDYFRFSEVASVQNWKAVKTTMEADTPDPCFTALAWRTSCQKIGAWGAKELLANLAHLVFMCKLSTWLESTTSSACT